MKKDKKITIIIVCIVIIIIATGIAIFLVIDHNKEMQEDAVALELNDNLTVEFSSTNKVSDFINNLQGTIIDDFEFEANKLGENVITFDYISIRNKKKTKSFMINVIDTELPIVEIDNSITLLKGKEVDLSKIFFSGDNCDSNPERKIIGNYDLNKIGVYNLTFSIKDSSNNETRKDFVLKIADKVNNSKTKAKELKFEDAIQNYKKSNTEVGIDVSQWQGEIDWQKVKNAGAKFAIIRVGYQKDFDNRNYVVDTYFEKNIEAATKLGLDVGIYFYSYAKSVEEAEEQAEWVADKIKGYSITLPVSFDWESWASFPKCSLSFYDINNIAKTYINKLQERGYIGNLYSSKNYLNKVWYKEKYDNIWLAHYTTKTDYSGKYNMWQVCDTGKIDGIDGDVDIDILYK